MQQRSTLLRLHGLERGSECVQDYASHWTTSQSFKGPNASITIWGFGVEGDVPVGVT